MAAIDPYRDFVPRRELAEMLKPISSQLDRIETHVTETNGRVTALEQWKARWEGARAAVGWVLPAVIACTSAIVSGLVVYVLTH